MPTAPSPSIRFFPSAARTRGGGVAASCMVLHRRLNTPLYVAEQEVDDAHLADSVVVERRVRIQREQRLGVLVPYGPEGCQLPRESGVVADGKRRADVVEDELRGKIFFFGVAA